MNNKKGHLKKKLWSFLTMILNLRIIVDAQPGKVFRKTVKKSDVGYRCDLNREKVTRDIIFSLDNNGLNFLDVGGKDGKLKYLLGIDREENGYNEELYAENYAKFNEKFKYFGLDLESKSENVLTGDICKSEFINEHLDYESFFDVIYSNNTFEHLKKPWIAVEHIYRMLKPGGICVIIAPFSWRYHEVPGDFFRYTHTAIPTMFEDHGEIETIITGYDVSERRTNNQGDGERNDLVPTDKFGPWRESWQMISVIKKL